MSSKQHIDKNDSFSIKMKIVLFLRNIFFLLAIGHRIIFKLVHFINIKCNKL